ncbi:unnamed protein product [Dovyalis caffra]|uniref:Uncharacterized protein n=1 Tax=Dovyalis caffra TaxID=77055 RepID=A0AAV1QSC4_9ROSI|nr:unnamed protein product [Dovyalis caffra]
MNMHRPKAMKRMQPKEKLTNNIEIERSRPSQNEDLLRHRKGTNQLEQDRRDKALKRNDGRVIKEISRDTKTVIKFE